MKVSRVLVIAAAIATAATSAGCSSSSPAKPGSSALTGSVAVARVLPMTNGDPCSDEAAPGYSLKNADVSVYSAHWSRGEVSVDFPIASTKLQPGKAARAADGTAVCRYSFSLEFSRPTPEPALYRIATTGRRSSVDVRTYTQDYSPTELHAGSSLDMMLTS